MGMWTRMRIRMRIRIRIKVKEKDGNKDTDTAEDERADAHLPPGSLRAAMPVMIRVMMNLGIASRYG